MNGFLPLLEAFAAFALTMVALTTAVSTLLGIFHRTLRSRAHGLRQMLTYYFRNELKPMLLRAAAPKAGWEDPESKLATFLVDVSCLPNARPVSPDGSDPRIAEVEKALEGRPLRRWSSLSQAVETLSPEEFETRLKASEIYGALEAVADPAGMDALLAQLKKRFIAYGAASTERFARKARIGTVILGFILAFGLNVDAFALLGRYMSDPELTAEVLQQQEVLLQQTEGDAGSASTGQLTGPPDVRLAAAQSALEKASALVEQLGADASQSDVSAVADAAKELNAVAQETAGELKAAAAAARASAEALGQARHLLADVTQAFPIGWTFYPACTPRATDSRCIRLMSQMPALAERCEADLLGGDSKLTPSDAAKKCGATNDALESIRWTLRHDPAGVARWFGGTLILGLMLGLGTPFWVEVVNNFLRARDLISNRSQSTPGAEEKSATSAPASAPLAAPAPTGGSRRLL